ncbi:hypothetical protein FJZ21_00050 [Candidatus Pacearchaeota archaeon]|nr:hypothetical protein [Candidatus Pacearchaeota archaeon]
MGIIRHRINTIEALKTVNPSHGVELDLRGYGDKLLMTHDPIEDSKLATYTDFEEYLKHWRHSGVMVLNIKEMGYEKRIIDLMHKYNVKDWFFQDAEFPYIYRATRKEGMRRVSIRFSEAEPIEYVGAQLDENGNPMLNWVWIDTNTKLPITKEDISVLSKFKTCLVCPERWGRPADIPKYIEGLKSLGFKLDAVMTAAQYVEQWEKSGVVKL